MFNFQIFQNLRKKCSKIRGRDIPIFEFYLDQIHLTFFQESPQKRMNATDSDSDFNSPQRKKIKREVFKTTEDNSQKIKKVGMRYRNVLIFIFNSEASVLLYLSVYPLVLTNNNEHIHHKLYFL